MKIYAMYKKKTLRQNKIIIKIKTKNNQKILKNMNLLLNKQKIVNC